MTVTEFSIQFDVLYNNITSNQAPGLNEYEKSVFLTKAQNELVKNYFLPQSNPKQVGFDGSPIRQIDYSNLLTTLDIDKSTDNTTDLPVCLEAHQFFLNDEDKIRIVSIVSEYIKFEDDTYAPVTPISLAEFHRLRSKPFKYPAKGKAWRIVTSHVTDKRRIEILPEYKYIDEDSTYILTYVRYPNPIILENLSGLTIEGESTAMTSELDETMHEEILQRAVEIAKVAWLGDVNVTLSTGQRSE